MVLISPCIQGLLLVILQGDLLSLIFMMFPLPRCRPRKACCCQPYFYQFIFVSAHTMYVTQGLLVVLLAASVYTSTTNYDVTTTYLVTTSFDDVTSTEAPQTTSLLDDTTQVTTEKITPEVTTPEVTTVEVTTPEATTPEVTTVTADPDQVSTASEEGML